ncbi:MAG: winged helix-turn-helix domain-containing protein, partial [Halobacteria archaeon]|nr:winged helix-turn-helix domain-containing protein [Halobacteria archaeon]
MSDSRRGRNVGSEAGVGSAPEGEGEAATDDGQPRVVGVDSDDAEELIGALSSETSRKILSELSDESSTASEVADSLGMTVQNARYHLEKLEEAGLIQVDETRYSPKGREMNVYAPTDGPQVVFVGGEEDTADIRDALLRFLGGLTVVAFASLVVQNVSRVLGDSFFGMGSSG